MNELKEKLASVLNLDDEKAQQGVDTVVEFLKGKLPESMHGFLDNMGEGDAVSSVVDKVQGLFGKD